MHLVFYSTKEIKGNVDCIFINDPPTLTDIRNLEKNISDKFCNGDPVTVTGWKKLGDGKRLNTFINNVKIEEGDAIELKDTHGSCVYIVNMGPYEFDGHIHTGWYMLLHSIDVDYPEDHKVDIRPLYDLLSDEIENYQVIHPGNN